METDFLNLVANVLEVSAEEITLDTKYKESGWDSLHMMMLVMEIEANYDVTIPLDKINSIESLRDFYDLIKE